MSKSSDVLFQTLGQPKKPQLQKSLCFQFAKCKSETLLQASHKFTDKSPKIAEYRNRQLNVFGFSRLQCSPLRTPDTQSYNLLTKVGLVCSRRNGGVNFWGWGFGALWDNIQGAFLEGDLNWHPAIGDHPKKGLSNSPRDSLEPIQRFYLTPKGSIEPAFWPPNRFYGHLDKKKKNHRQGPIEPFASNPPPHLHWEFPNLVVSNLVVCNLYAEAIFCVLLRPLALFGALLGTPWESFRVIFNLLPCKVKI